MLTTINKELFKKSQPVLGLIAPNKLINSFSSQFKGLLYTREKFKSIQPYDADQSKKIILLSDSLKNEEDLPENLNEFIKKNEIKLIEKIVDLDYNNYSYEQVLKQLLPDGVVIPFSFESIGHIAHLNLRDEQLPYRFLIGQAILEKNPKIKTVINKVGKIDTVFRTFKSEVLAGENNFITEIKENECIFKFNFEEVYWNSRLQVEHFNLVNQFKSTDIICDMFAGVGPFALPAVKLMKCKVFANDLNPNSVKYMKENAHTNKIPSNLLEVFNMDARDFVKHLLSDQNPTKKPVPFTQVIMNLPSTSIEFLDVFKEIFLNPNQSPPIPSPTIHCYTFTKSAKDSSSNVVDDTKKNVESIIGVSLPNNFKCEEVRDVSVGKRMMRISFKMPTLDTLTNKRNIDQVDNNDENENNTKKLKLEVEKEKEKESTEIN